jgi:small conductance mechanosensitive channel
VLGLESVAADCVIIQAQAKTMPGMAAPVARELRWRIKKAFDAEGITIIGGAPVDGEADETAGPAAAVAAPSQLSNPSSPQAEAAQPIQLPASGGTDAGK